MRGGDCWYYHGWGAACPAPPSSPSSSCCPPPASSSSWPCPVRQGLCLSDSIGRWKRILSNYNRDEIIIPIESSAISSATVLNLFKLCIYITGVIYQELTWFMSILSWESEEKSAPNMEHGSVTSHPVRKLWQTDSSLSANRSSKHFFLFHL